LTRAELRRRAQAAVAWQEAPVVETVAVPAPVPSVASRRRVRAAEPHLVGTRGTVDETLPDETVPAATALDGTVPDDTAADVADLPDLEPEALAVLMVHAPQIDVAIEVPHPAHADDVPVTAASDTAASDVSASAPTSAPLPTSPIALATPTRRVRRRPAREAVQAPADFELETPADASGGPVAVAAAAADEADADEALASGAAAAARAQETLDEFEAAARLFAFTGETPVQRAAAAVDEDAGAAQHPTDHMGRRRLLSFKRVATTSFSVGVFGVVGLMAVGMTTPPAAVAAAQGVDAAKDTMVLTASDVSEDPETIQAYVAPADVQSSSLERTDGFEAATLADLAAESGISNFSNFFVNDPTAAIQWPFAVGVPITYGFGMRSGTMHEGADFVPGAGSPVQAIADGTVRIATESGGAFGVTVLIDHVIDGELVSSRYAHMQYDSLTVTPGETVTVGTVIGKTGNTGRSYGAHTHFEILAGGTTAIDPIPWLRAHTAG
jgi:murein DD-endopeptidase MepM/ murein hydrolase activator NlpD